MVYPAVRVLNFISAVFSLLISLYFNVQISQPYRIDGVAKILRYFNRNRLWTKYFFQNTVQNSQYWYFLKLGPFPLRMKFYSPNI